MAKLEGCYHKKSAGTLGDRVWLADCRGYDHPSFHPVLFVDGPDAHGDLNGTSCPVYPERGINGHSEVVYPDCVLGDVCRDCDLPVPVWCV